MTDEEETKHNNRIKFGYDYYHTLFLAVIKAIGTFDPIAGAAIILFLLDWGLSG